MEGGGKKSYVYNVYNEGEWNLIIYLFAHNWRQNEIINRMDKDAPNCKACSI